MPPSSAPPPAAEPPFPGLPPSIPAAPPPAEAPPDPVGAEDPSDPVVSDEPPTRLPAPPGPPPPDADWPDPLEQAMCKITSKATVIRPASMAMQDTHVATRGPPIDPVASRPLRRKNSDLDLLESGRRLRPECYAAWCGTSVVGIADSVGNGWHVRRSPAWHLRHPSEPVRSRQFGTKNGCGDHTRSAAPPARFVPPSEVRSRRTPRGSEIA